MTKENPYEDKDLSCPEKGQPIKKMKFEKLKEGDYILHFETKKFVRVIEITRYLDTLFPLYKKESNIAYIVCSGYCKFLVDTKTTVNRLLLRRKDLKDFIKIDTLEE